MGVERTGQNAEKELYVAYNLLVVVFPGRIAVIQSLKIAVALSIKQLLIGGSYSFLKIAPDKAKGSSDTTLGHTSSV